MATVAGEIRVQIDVQREPLLYVAGLFYAIDNDRGGLLNRLANRLVDKCTCVELVEYDAHG